MTPEETTQLDNWFTYHAPTEETRPKYDAIRAAEQACQEFATKVSCAAADYFDRCTDVYRAFAEVILANAPPSADRSAAIRCVRLARMATNESAVEWRKTGGAGSTQELDRLDELATQNITMARWQANAAIACT